MSLFRKKKKPRIDLDAIDNEVDATIKVVAEQDEHVTRLTTYLTWRNGENHFGRDFDISFNVRKPAVE